MSAAAGVTADSFFAFTLESRAVSVLLYNLHNSRNEVLGEQVGKLMPDPAITPPEPSDEILAARVAQRDVAAFSLLYDRYARVVYSLAAHLLSAGEAEDIVQDVFFRLWHKADQFDPARGRFASWFMAITRHHLMDALRKRSQQQRMVAAEEIDQLLVTTADPTVDVENASYLLERGRDILYALKRLPPEQRRVLVLAYFGGLSQSAIAEQLDWPLGTVKKRIRLGLHKLRLYLSEHQPASIGSFDAAHEYEDDNDEL
jgi:RNA polymerase sigma-70 factor (ECF subfamily)